MQCFAELLADQSGQLYSHVRDAFVGCFLKWPLADSSVMQRSLLQYALHSHMLVASLGIDAWGALLMHGCLQAVDTMTPLILPDPQSTQISEMARIHKHQLTSILQHLKAHLPPSSSELVSC